MSTSVENSQASKSVWSSLTPYLIPPAAAGAAVIPIFYGFMAKSALQKGQEMPHFNFRGVVTGGFKASPTVGAIVGIQMVAQNAIEQGINKILPEGESKAASMVLSALIVGAISAPPLAVLNGQSMGYSPIESLKKLTIKQTGAIVGRETSFLFAIRISDPVSEAMRKQFGDHKGVVFSAAFMSGVIGSLVGHPADTALTCWQAGIKVQARHLMCGATIRAGTVGAFSVIYKIVKEGLMAKFHD